MPAMRAYAERVVEHSYLRAKRRFPLIAANDSKPSRAFGKSETPIEIGIAMTHFVQPPSFVKSTLWHFFARDLDRLLKIAPVHGELIVEKKLEQEIASGLRVQASFLLYY